MRKPGPNPCSTLPEEDAFSPFLSSLDSSEPDSEPRTLEVSSRTVGIPPAWGSRRQEILGSHHRKCDLNITNWDFTSDNKQFSQQKAGISPAQRRRWSNKKGGAQGQVFGFRIVGSFLEWTVKHRANIRLSGKMQLLVKCFCTHNDEMISSTKTDFQGQNACWPKWQAIDMVPRFWIFRVAASTYSHHGW